MHFLPITRTRIHTHAFTHTRTLTHTHTHTHIPSPLCKHVNQERASTCERSLSRFYKAVGRYTVH
ncbi:hypothetical protein EON63_00235 [archaeon]|nr:MAG: hypothetical protein EON63_00235 [archaeon]